MKTFLAILGLLCASISVQADGLSYCYWNADSISRPGIGSFGISDLPTDLCTHLVYAFVGLSPSADITLLVDQVELEGKTNKIEEFTSIGASNPDLKFILSVGGWSEASNNFTIVVNNDTLRATYVANVVAFLKKNKFNGFNIDWEYPAQRGGQAADKEGFVSLLRDLKAAFKPENLELSVAVAATQANIDISFDVPAIAEQVDYIHVMAYDLHGSWETVTGVNAPLFPQPIDAAGDVLNVNSSMYAWINSGAPRSKLLVGISLYGRTFNLTSLDNVGLGAPSTGAGAAQPYTAEGGVMSYYEICTSQNANPSKWNITETEDLAYANSDNLWVGYDTVATTYAKGQYAKNEGFAGVVYWAADLDDFSGQCGDKFPLISSAIKGYTEATVLCE